MQTIVNFGVAYIHAYIHAHIPTFKHYIPGYVYTCITHIYICILTKRSEHSERQSAQGRIHLHS